jgi:putative transposase
MSERYKFFDPAGMYFVTSTIIGWVDLFTRRESKHIVIDSLKYCQTNKGLQIHAWCLMPSHLHMIISSVGAPLSGILRDFKKFTTSAIINEIKTGPESRHEWMLELFGKAAEQMERVWHYKVWQDGNHPVLLRSKKFINQRLDYLHWNPVEAEIVEKPEDYLYSSARDYYCNKKGLLKVDWI